MAAHHIPRRPTSFKKVFLDETALDCLTWYVLFEEQSKSGMRAAFGKFSISKASPSVKDGEYLTLFESAEAKAYIEEYKIALKDFFTSKSTTQRQEDETIEDYKARRKSESVEKIVAKISEMVDTVDMDTLTDVVRAMKETGYFEGETQTTPARRYLPEDCNNCRYKQFVEENIDNGKIIDTDAKPKYTGRR